MKARIVLHQFSLRQWLQDLPHLSQIIISEDNFQIQASGGLCSEGLIIGGIFAFQIWGLLYGGAYTRRGLFSEFNGIQDLTKSGCERITHMENSFANTNLRGWKVYNWAIVSLLQLLHRSLRVYENQVLRHPCCSQSQWQEVCKSLWKDFKMKLDHA